LTVIMLPSIGILVAGAISKWALELSKAASAPEQIGF